MGQRISKSSSVKQRSSSSSSERNKKRNMAITFKNKNETIPHRKFSTAKASDRNSERNKMKFNSTLIPRHQPQEKQGTSFQLATHHATCTSSALTGLLKVYVCLTRRLPVEANTTISPRLPPFCPAYNINQETSHINSIVMKNMQYGCKEPVAHFSRAKASAPSSEINEPTLDGYKDRVTNCYKHMWRFSKSSYSFEQSCTAVTYKTELLFH